MKTFDDGLSEDGIRRDHADYTRPDPPAPGKIERFMVSPMCELRADGIFNLRGCPIGMWWKVKNDA